jgi:CheY-like chemotaxis protein
MRRGQTQEFELPDDLVIGVGDGDDADGRMGAGSTLPQDLFPLGEPKAIPVNQATSREFADTRPAAEPDTQPAGLPAHSYVKPAAPEVTVASAQPIIAPMHPAGRLPGDGPQPKRVLVVDDDATVRMYLRARLMLRGHLQLLEAANGAQALEFVQAQRFDAVLLDVDMGAQNGYEVCRAVRSHVRSMGGKQPRIYMITSRSSMLDKMRAKMAGADAFLSKPPHPGELAELLAQL